MLAPAARVRRRLRRLPAQGRHVWAAAAVRAENRLQAARPAAPLVILDDAFPQRLSAFRIAEYNRYLAAYPGALVYSTATAFPLLGETRSFAAVRAEYEAHYPRFAGRVRRYHPDRDLRGALINIMFLNNAFTFLPAIQKQRLPFIFTLYPGGGFQLNQPDTAAKLRALFASPHFQTVIVTQNVTRQYLLDQGLCPAEKIAFIYGGVLPSDSLAAGGPARRYYGRDKATLDLCFVANKYVPGGVDKGYDVFLAVARRLAGRYPTMRFHVVGPFGPADGDVGDLGERITFYGSRPTDFFPNFYAGMDLILSPNVPFVLSPGAFDGFPTGGCVEAGLCGVAVFCTDPLGLNVALKDGEEIVIIPYSAGAICDRIARYHDDYAGLCQLGQRGQAALRRVFDIDAQMAPRLQLIDATLARIGPR